MPDVNASNLGDRSLIIHVKEGARKESKYYYLFEEQWREYGLDKLPKEFSTLVESKVVLAKPSSVFVNFDQLAIAGDPQVEGYAEKNSPATQPETIVIVDTAAGDGKSFYAIPRNVWSRQPLPDGADSDAGVLVRRGSVIAAIPDNNVPVGTFCALLNLAALK